MPFVPLPTRRRLRWELRREKYLARARRRRRADNRKWKSFNAPGIVGRSPVWDQVTGTRQKYQAKVIPPDVATRPWDEAGFLEVPIPAGPGVKGVPPRVVWIVPGLADTGTNTHPSSAVIDVYRRGVKYRGKKLNRKRSGRRRERAIRYARFLWASTGDWPVWAPVGWKLIDL